MSTTIKGYYEKGQIILDETPSLTARTAVLVTFIVDDNIVQKSPKRKLGSLEGKVNLPDDFNSPIEEFKGYE